MKNTAKYPKRKRGRPRTFDHGEIRSLLESKTMTDVEVANKVRCSPHHIWRLKTEMGLIPDRWAVEA